MLPDRQPLTEEALGRDHLAASEADTDMPIATAPVVEHERANWWVCVGMDPAGIALPPVMRNCTRKLPACAESHLDEEFALTGPRTPGLVAPCWIGRVLLGHCPVGRALVARRCTGERLRGDAIPDEASTDEVLATHAIPVVFIAGGCTKAATHTTDCAVVAPDVTTDVVGATNRIAVDHDVPAVVAAVEVLHPGVTPAMAVILRIAIPGNSSTAESFDEVPPGLADHRMRDTAAAGLHDRRAAIPPTAEILVAAGAPPVNIIGRTADEGAATNAAIGIDEVDAATNRGARSDTCR